MKGREKDFASVVSGAVQLIGEYKDDKITVHSYNSHDGASGVNVTLADGRRVFDANDWGGWHIAEFHPGAWCDYIMPVAEQAKAARDAHEAAERAKREASEAEKWTSVDDAAMFPGNDEPDPCRSFKWIVEVEVSETWVADGFDLTQERLKGMLESHLGFSSPSETRCRIIHTPAEASIARAQGYASVDDWQAANAAGR